MSLSYGQHFMAHLRLAILRCLKDAPASSANASILKTVSQDLGLPATRDQVNTAIGWLAEQGLVNRSELGAMVIATLLDRGLDVAEGRARVDGVARPDLGG